MTKKYEIYDVNAEMYECNSNFPNMLGLKLYWNASLGFGELSFYYNTKTNKWQYDTECMGKEFSKAVLDKWIEGMMGE